MQPLHQENNVASAYALDKLSRLAQQMEKVRQRKAKCLVKLHTEASANRIIWQDCHTDGDMHVVFRHCDFNKTLQT